MTPRDLTAEEIAELQLQTFAEAWDEKRAAGYCYGDDALEQVRLGWEMAHESIAKSVHLPSLLAMASRLLELEAAMYALDKADATLLTTDGLRFAPDAESLLVAAEHIGFPGLNAKDSTASAANSGAEAAVNDVAPVVENTGHLQRAAEPCACAGLGVIGACGACGPCLRNSRQRNAKGGSNA